MTDSDIRHLTEDELETVVGGVGRVCPEDQE